MLAPETRRLRVWGLAIIVVSLAVLGPLLDRLQASSVGSVSPAAEVLLAFAAFAVIVNAFTVGLVILLAGLRSLPLRDARVRRGALARLGAINLALPCLLVALLAEADLLANLDDSEWLQAAALVLLLVVLRRAVLLFRSGWKHEAVSASEALARDPRPPVVYLRSFGTDDDILVASGPWLGKLGSYLAYTAAVSPEQELAWIMERVGPVVAIGKPGEPLPELGAARMYVGDSEWRSVVDALLSRAALVVIRAGSTPNLWWEIEQAMSRCAPERVVVVALGPEKALAGFTHRFAAAFGVPQAPPDPARSPLIAWMLRVLFPYGRSSGKILYFDPLRQPHERALTLPLSISMIVLGPYSPHGAALRAGFRHVFAELGLPWRTLPTLTPAVLLALFGGAIGLHWFYLGQRRKAVRRCWFCWTGIPMLLGIADAFRLARLDDEQFRAAFTAPSWSHPIQAS